MKYLIEITDGHSNSYLETILENELDDNVHVQKLNETKFYVITHAEYGFGGLYSSEQLAKDAVSKKTAYGGFPWKVKEIIIDTDEFND